MMKAFQMNAPDAILFELRMEKANLELPYLDE
jgi:hypothetical protein